MLRSVLIRSVAAVALVSAGCASLSASEPTAASNTPIVAMAQANLTQRSTPFTGAKANKGFASKSIQSGKTVLTWSDDFVTVGGKSACW